MGMDLYKYKITKGEGDIYLGRELTKEELSYFDNFDVYSLDDADMEKVAEKVYNLFGKDAFEKTFFYDFREETENKYFLKLEPKLFEKLEYLESVMFDDTDDNLKENAQKKYEELFSLINHEISTVSEKEKIIKINSGEIYLFESIPTLKEYYIKGEAEEVGYMRKPFRHFSTPPKSKNGTTTLYIDNTTGVPKEIYDVFKKKILYSPDCSLMVFTNKHNAEKEFLASIGEDYKEYGSSLFPLEDDELISIDW